MKINTELLRLSGTYACLKYYGLIVELLIKPQASPHTNCYLVNR